MKITDKTVAIIAAIPLVAAETGLNAEHIASHAGWASTLVLGAVGGTLAAAITLPIAERAWIAGSRFKAIGLGAFFFVMLAFSFTTSVSRVAGHADGEMMAARAGNARIDLAKAALADAVAARDVECTKRGPRCRAEEANVQVARAAVAAMPAIKVEAGGTARIAAATGLDVATVALYQPLLFPLALQIGGFFFLAYGFAPAAARPLPVVEMKPVTVKPRIRKASPKAITHEAIMPKIDGRKTRGMKIKLANDM